MLTRENYNVSGVSITIRAGSSQEKYPGIAHLLEHSLFLGSKKYHREEDEFMDCVAKYSGHTNAFTANDMTTYYFESDS